MYAFFNIIQPLLSAAYLNVIKVAVIWVLE